MSTLGRLLALHRPQLGAIAAGCALQTLVILSNVALLALSGWFITAMALAGLARAPFEVFTPAAAIRALALIRTGGRYAERLVTHEATFRELATLRAWFFAALEPLAPAALDDHRGGDLMSRLRADIDSLDNLTLRVICPTVAALLSALILLAALLPISPRAALILAAGLLVTGVLVPLLATALGAGPGHAAVATRAELRAGVLDAIGGLAELEVAGALARRTDAIARLTDAHLAARRDQLRANLATNALSATGTQLTLAAILAATIPATAAQLLSGPALATLSFLALASFEAVAPLPAAFQAMGETLAAARRLFAIIDTPVPIREPAHPLPLPQSFDIRFRNIRLDYRRDDPARPPALDDLDLSVPNGAAVALVGESGAGKSSVLALLLRLRDPACGSITIGGVPLAGLASEAARTLFSVVAQETHLFHASVRDNLLLARPAATDAELGAALADADLERDIAALPQGLDTMVGENAARLSGGQARRLAIARAFLKDAPILLLDEPTEGLDPLSEAAVLDALGRLQRGRTTLIVTHRDAPLTRVDAIATLSRGRILSVRPTLDAPAPA